MTVSLVAMANCIGCSLDSGETLESLQRNATPFSAALVQATTELPESESMDGSAVPSKTLAAKSEMPSPGRLNAFELSSELRVETPSQETAGKREIYVIGFVEVDIPSVMLAIDGRTQVLKAGDTFERITVQEIAPPRARLSCDGVTWNASILDRRSSPSEASARKKGG